MKTRPAPTPPPSGPPHGLGDTAATAIAAALGVEPTSLTRLRPSVAPRSDSPLRWYQAYVAGARLAVRADAMLACVADVPPGTTPEALAERLAAVHIASPVPEALRRAVKARPGRTGWVPVAQGQPPAQGGRLLWPDGEPLSVDDLSVMSLALDDLLAGAALDADAVSATRALAVLPGDRVGQLPAESAAGRDVFGRPLPPPDLPGGLQPGEGIQVSAEDRLLRSGAYGYLAVSKGQLLVRPAFWIDADRMRVYWLILDPEPCQVTVEVCRGALQALGVTTGLMWPKLEQLAARLGRGEQRRGAFLVAEGTPPVAGQDARVELLVDLERRAGEILPDGSIDFRDVNFAASVGPGQMIARRWPATPGQPGRNVLGEPLPAPDGADRVLQAGSNVRVELAGEEERFFADIAGAARLEGDVLTVVESLTIHGDVDYNTGNLDFEGEIIVQGSVAQGFLVRGRRGITVTGVVEDAAQLESEGDITAGAGIIGRKTRVEAGGSVRTAYVQEATVHAGGDIVLGKYCYHGRLFAGGRVEIAKGGGQRGGSVVGGEVWATHGMELYLAGAPTGTDTQLAAGVDPRLARRLDETRRYLTTTRELMTRLLSRFGLVTIDVAHIRNMIAASSGPRRALLAQSARRLGELAQAYQQLEGRLRTLHGRMSAEADAEIRIRDRAYPKVRVRVGEFERLLNEEVVSPRFHVAEGVLRER